MIFFKKSENMIIDRLDFVACKVDLKKKKKKVVSLLLDSCLTIPQWRILSIIIFIVMFIIKTTYYILETLRNMTIRI